MLLLLLGGALGCARESAADPPVERHAGLAGSRLLALADDQLLLWEPTGRAELRAGAGTWTPEFRLPLKPIVAAQADAEGFLIAGSAGAGSAAVVALSPLGKERVRWTLPGDGAFGFVADARGPRAVTRGGIVALNPDGTIGALEPFAKGTTPSVIAREGGDVLCRPADLSEAHSAPGECARGGAHSWRFEAQFVEAPVACGDWLAVGDGFEPGGMETRRIAAHSLGSGEVGGRAAFLVHPAVACASSNELLVGEKRLVLLRLPGLEAGWSRQIEGSAPVRDLAVLKSFFAYRIDGSLEVMLVPRPGS